MGILDGIADGSTAPVTREEAFQLFKDAIRKVWGDRGHDFVLPVLVLSAEEPAGGFQASIAHPGNERPMVIGSSLIRRCSRYTLRIADRLLALGRDATWKIMVHEAVHVGIINHGVDFRRLVREHGGAVSEMASENAGAIEVQQKKGSRFVTVRTFEDEAEARAWGREQAKANPGTKWRYQM